MRATRSVLGRLVAVLATLALSSPATPHAWGPSPLDAQQAERTGEVDATREAGADEVQLLREAGLREGAGELAAAESLLRRILEARPGSVPALLSLERVLRIQGRLETLPPLVRAALADDPTSPLLNQVLLRTLAALDRPDAVESAARAWMRAEPELEIPYREAARVWQQRGDHDRARAVLEEGRDRIPRPDALALELGDLYASLDQPSMAVAEWDRAVGPEARGMIQVRRRIRALPDGGASLLPELVARLADPPSTPPRLHGAVELAVDAGLQDRAREVAATLLPAKSLEERSRFLSGLARQADAAGQERLAHWAYGRLLEAEEQGTWVRDRMVGGGGSRVAGQRAGASDVRGGARLLAIRERLAELALVVGDTAGAATGFESIEAAYPPGSPERREAAAHRIELVAAHDVDAAAAALGAFRADFPNAPEEDRLVALVAAELIDDGRRTAAEPILAGVRGPRSSLLRGRLALERGETGAARAEYMAAASALRGAEATAALGVATLLGRVSEESGAALGAALGQSERGAPGEAVDGLLAALPVLRPEDRPPLLEFAAGMAQRAGLEEDARAVWRRIVADHPRATEAPAALLALARSVRGEPGGDEEARELLERLILEHPRSALVPQARRALDGLDRVGVGGHQDTGSR